MKHETLVKKLRYILVLHLGILLEAVGIYFFKAPNGFATGGISGLSILLARALPLLSQATYMTVLNALLLVIGVLVLGRRCGLLTIYCTLMLSGLNQAFEWLMPLSAPLTDQPLLELVYAILLTGIGAAILFNCNASSGGTDIVALILKKYTRMDVGRALLLSDAIVAAATFFVFDVKTGLFSMIGLFAKAFVVDDIIESLNLCKAFTIVTTKAEEIDAYILHTLKHSATVEDGKGAFSGEGRKIIITVCRNAEALRLRKKVKEIDPHAFIIITKSSEILGKGFRDA